MKNRIHSIDVLRALAIFFMILCHFPIFLSAQSDQHEWLYFFSNHIVGDFAAPIFLFLVGFSQAICKPKAATQSYKKGFAIFIIGLIFSFIIRGPQAVFEWDILPLIGVSIIIIESLRNFSNRTFLILASLIFVCSPLLRNYSHYLDVWGNSMSEVSGIQKIFPGLLLDPISEYEPVNTFKGIINGFFLVGYFPLFPWLLFSLLGFWYGNLFKNKMNPSFSAITIIFGILLSILGITLAHFGAHNSPDHIINRFITALSFYPSTPSMELVQIGIVLILCGMTQLLFDSVNNSSPLKSKIINISQIFSRYSFSIYILHHIVIFWPLWVAGYFKGDIEHFKANAFTVPTSFTLSILFILIIIPFLKIWDKKDSIYSLEWSLNKLVQKKIRFNS